MKNKSLKTTIFTILLASILPSAIAHADDVIVNLSSKKLALALAEAQNTAQKNDNIAKSINDTLRKCLSLTGLFNLIHPNQFLPGLATEPLDPQKTNYDSWFSTGADALVKVAYNHSPQSLSIDPKLYDISQKKHIQLPYTPPSISQSSYKPAIYAFVNAVVKFYTGADGFFGQQILAVQKGSKNSPSKIVRMNIDGSDISVISKNDTINMLPNWGPNGSIIYTSYKFNNPDLMINDGSEKRLSKFEGMNSGADYCASKGKIALTISKDGNAEIYTINADGSNPQRLTNSSAIDTSPSWSSDCSKIAFVSDRGGNPQIYIMNADGSSIRRLTTIGEYNTNPAWSKKTNKIAFSARDEYKGLDIFVISEDGSELERITQNQGKNDSPSWSPDGRYLIFTSTRDGGQRIYISTADGKAQAPITTSGSYESPVWSH